MTQKLLFKTILVVLIVLVAFAVVRSASAGSAGATISISDLTGGNPVVSTGTLTGPVVSLSFERALITGQLNPSNSLSGPISVGTRSVIFDEPTGDAFGPRLSDFITLTGSVVTLSFERALITGQLNPDNSGEPIPVGTRSLIFDEPSGDPFGPRLSDFITLTASEVTGTGCVAPFPSGPCQNISVLFESDGAPNFDQHIAALPGGTPHLLETGTIQNVTALLNSLPGSLVILASSDLATSEVPEPTSLTLVGAGLILLLAVIGKRVRS